jgi:hypothetical protein
MIPVQGRLMSIATVGVLVLLSAGGGIWSALTGPRVADVQLQDAASNTVAAPSFVATVDATVKETLNGPFGSPAAGGSSGPQSQTSVTSETVVYQAPDRVIVKESAKVTPASGQGTNETDIVQIGSSCWQPAAQLGSQPASCRASAIPMFLDLVSGLEKTSRVTEHDGTYDLTPSDSRRFLTTAFLGGTGGGTPPKNVIVQVRIQGSDVVWEHLSFGSTQVVAGGTSGTGQSQTISVSLDLVARFTEIGSAPPVVRPAGAPTSTG